MKPTRSAKAKPRPSSHVKDHHADHSAELRRAARIKGPVDAIERMIREGRYCPAIIQQIKSARSALKGLECAVLESHLHGCVRQAFESKDPSDASKKISELIELIRVND
jgi:DNA-binding FrmR family transcriptional regulator